MIDRSQKLQELIDDNPGIQFREIMRSSGLKNGVLSHYLKKLEDGGVIKVMRGPRQVRFYSPSITEEESIVIKALRKETPRDLLLTLIKDDGLEFSQLVSEVKKSPSTLKRNATKKQRFFQDTNTSSVDRETLAASLNVTNVIIKENCKLRKTLKRNATKKQRFL